MIVYRKISTKLVTWHLAKKKCFWKWVLTSKDGRIQVVHFQGCMHQQTTAFEMNRKSNSFSPGVIDFLGAEQSESSEKRGEKMWFNQTQEAADFVFDQSHCSHYSSVSLLDFLFWSQSPVKAKIAAPILPAPMPCPTLLADFLVKWKIQGKDPKGFPMQDLDCIVCVPRKSDLKRTKCSCPQIPH